MALLQPVDGPRELHGRRRLEVFNPATLERIGEIEVTTAVEVRRAVERARAAQKSWAALGFDERGRLMLKVRDALLERVDSLVETIGADTGKPRIEALASEISPCCASLTFHAKKAKSVLGDVRERPRLLKTKKLVRSYRPMGVIGAITPWNFPLLLSLDPTLQALMAGNAVVLKPSEVTPFVGLALAEVFAAAGLPDGVFQVVTGDASTGAALVDAGCDMISFTGSASTGRKIAEFCARQLIPCALELGGKDSMIICEDADLDRASQRAVWGAYANSGQVCTSIERIYVLEEVAQPFVDRVVALTRQLRQGPEARGEIDVGALTFPAQLEVIERQIGDAVDKGARVLSGGRRNPRYEGYFYEPTVLVDVDHSMDIMREETFGPTLPIQSVKDQDEALRLANDSSHRSQASLWTRDSYRARQLAGRISAAGVTVNDVAASYATTLGGFVQNEVGSTNGGVNLKKYCDMQSVVLRRFRLGRGALSYPYTGDALRARQRTLRLLYRSPIGKLFGN